MSYPCVSVLGAYTAGLFLADRLDFGFWPCWAFAAGLWLLCILVRNRSIEPLTLLALAWLTGALNHTQQTSAFSEADLRAATKPIPEDLEVRGRLIGRLVPTEEVRNGKLISRMSGVIEILQIRNPRQRGHWRSARGRAQCQLQFITTEVASPGSTVAARGILAEPPEALAPGAFDYRDHLRRRGIYRLFKVAESTEWTAWMDKAQSASVPWTERFRQWSVTVLARGLPKTDSSARLTQAMVMGLKEGIDASLREEFLHSGTMHLFAISGLHISLIAGIVLNLLLALRMPRAAAAAAGILVLWGYTAVTEWQASAVRASVMMTVVLGATILRRPPSLLNSLALAALLILVYDSQQLFQPGFQLSFAVVWALAIMAPGLESWFLIPFRPDPMQLEEARSRRRRAWLTVGRWLAKALSISVSAWMGSAPLVAYYFGLVTPVSIIANLIVVPLGDFALMSALLSLACGGWLVETGICFNHASWTCMNLMQAASKSLATVPRGHWYVPAPTAWETITLHAAILLFIAGMRARLHRKHFVASGVSLGLLATCAWGLRAWDSRLTLIAVGDGTAVFVDRPGQHDDLLINTGPEWASRSVIIPALRKAGVDQLAGLLLSHATTSQTGGASNLLHALQPASLFTSKARLRSKTHLRNRQMAANLGVLQETEAGASIADWKVLHPGSEPSAASAADAAIVLRGEFSTTRVLILSGLSKTGQRRLLARNQAAELRADILVLNVNSRSPAAEVTEPWMATVNPSVVLIADGVRRVPESPPAMPSRIPRGPWRILRTSELGSIQIILN